MKNIKLMVLVAAPEGIEAVLAADPDVQHLHLRHRRGPERPRLHRPRPGRRRRPHLRHQKVPPFRRTAERLALRSADAPDLAPFSLALTCRSRGVSLVESFLIGS